MVQPFDSKTGKGNGFILKDLKSASLAKTVKKVLQVYKDEKNWHKLIKNGMREDVSWKNPAKKYVQLYQKCMSGKR
jgi:starch synthase